MDNVKPLVSIIVPVYNAEKTLRRCVDSIIAQTLKNIEIILVNDGSTDGSPDLLQKYARHKNVKIIDKPNGGLSSARNLGLDNAFGEFVGFVDSDDWIQPDMYEELYQSALQNDSDIVLSGHYRVSGNDITEYPLKLERNLFVDQDIVSYILIPMVGSDIHDKNDLGIEPCVWRNIYKREVIEQNKIRFESERIYISEDILFNIDFLSNAKRLSIVPESFYYYVHNTVSLTQIYRKDRFDKECILYEHIIEKLKTIGIYDFSANRARRTFISRSRMCIMQEAYGNRESSIFKRIRNIRRISKTGLLVEALRSYPVSNYPIRLKLVNYCIKYHLAALLFLVAFIFYKRK